MHNLTDTSGAVVVTADAPWSWDAAGQGWRAGGHLVMDPGRAYAASAPVTDIPALDFMLLFSIDEHAAIRTSQDPKVQVFYNMVTDARRQVIALGHPMVTIGVDYLVQIGLIAPGRASQVLAGQAPEE